jgi:hypothetical protein
LAPNSPPNNHSQNEKSGASSAAQVEMFAVIVLDHRLAFVFLCALVLGAAVPLAMAWARVLPEDAPPLASPGVSSQGSKEELPAEESRTEKKDPFAMVLLFIVTLSYVLQFPGLPADTALHWLSTLMPETRLNCGLLMGRAFFVVTPGLAACYSVLRPHSLRVPLIGAGILVLLLWILEPILLAAMTSSSLRELCVFAFRSYAVAAFTCCNAAATSFRSGTTGMS